MTSAGVDPSFLEHLVSEWSDRRKSCAGFKHFEPEKWLFGWIIASLCSSAGLDRRWNVAWVNGGFLEVSQSTASATFSSQGDKLSRVLGVSAMIEAGRLFLPTEAPWLAEFSAELLAFPNSHYDDQVDALSQLLGWVMLKAQYTKQIIAGPIVVRTPRGIWP